MLVKYIPGDQGRRQKLGQLITSIFPKYYVDTTSSFVQLWKLLEILENFHISIFFFSRQEVKKFHNGRPICTNPNNFSLLHHVDIIMIENENSYQEIKIKEARKKIKLSNLRPGKLCALPLIFLVFSLMFNWSRFSLFHTAARVTDSFSTTSTWVFNISVWYNICYLSVISYKLTNPL